MAILKLIGMGIGYTLLLVAVAVAMPLMCLYVFWMATQPE